MTFCYPIESHQVFQFRIFIDDDFIYFCRQRSFIIRNSGPPNYLQENMFLFVSNSCKTSDDINLKDTNLHYLKLLASSIYCLRLTTKILKFLVLFFMSRSTALPPCLFSTLLSAL